MNLIIRWIILYFTYYQPLHFILGDMKYAKKYEVVCIALFDISVSVDF